MCGCVLLVYTPACGQLCVTLLARNPPRLQTGTCERVLEGHTKGVLCLAVLPADVIVSGSKDHSLRLWDPLVSSRVRRLGGHVDLRILWRADRW